MKKVVSYVDLLKKYNSLEIKYKALQESVKEKLLKNYFDQIAVPLELNRLKKENKNLRQKVKSLKDVIKDNKA